MSQNRVQLSDKLRIAASTVQLWLKTLRFQAAPAGAAVTWLGYVSISEVDLASAILVGLVGLLANVWILGHNEISDAEYDAKHSDAGGHPIASGEINKHKAIVVTGVIVASSFGIYTLLEPGSNGYMILAVSYLFGYAYNNRSKVDWWSNLYFGLWGFTLVYAGAEPFGEYTATTFVLATAMGIYLFVGVIQGDLKDLDGPENTFSEHFGVELKSVDTDISPTRIAYSTGFLAMLASLKVIELVMLIAGYSFLSADPLSLTNFNSIAILIGAIPFLLTVQGYVILEYDRAKIKRRYGLHVLVAFVLYGLAIIPASYTLGVFVALVPGLWFILFNKILHSNVLDPDI
jgi:hypothetical protein